LFFLLCGFCFPCLRVRQFFSQVLYIPLGTPGLREPESLSQSPPCGMTALGSLGWFIDSCPHWSQSVLTVQPGETFLNIWSFRKIPTHWLCVKNEKWEVTACFPALASKAKYSDILGLQECSLQRRYFYCYFTTEGTEA
jgi:hypothetical protein